MPFSRHANLRQRVYALPLAAAVALSMWPISPVSATDTIDRSVIGQWKLTTALDFAEIASRDERQAKQLIGNTLTISRKKLKLGKEVCPSPDFESERVDPVFYLSKHYRASASQLGLPNPVTIVHLNCTAAFIKNRNRLVIFWDGWFFDAVRISK